MLVQFVCGAFLVVGVTAGLFNLNNQGNLLFLPPNNNNNNNNNNLNNRIRDTFMSGVLRGKNSQCNGTAALAQSQGECKPPKECRQQGGTVSGTCALVGSCCILENRCGDRTRAKISYFTSPTTLQPSCGLTVLPFSQNVCQLRLDFERFQIEGPPAPPAAPFCISDSFTVIGSSVGNLGFQALCGGNAGQHIYVPVNNSVITLQFALTSNRNGLTVANPDWRIKITQLECNTIVQDYSSLQTALTSLYQRHRTKNSNAQNDRDLIAPPGCLQFFTNPSGTYESFNYNNGQGPTIANLDYAVCFRRDLTTCGVIHTIQQFQLAALNDPDCRSLANVFTDWVQIPGSTLGTAPAPFDYWCGIPGNVVITSRQSGPLFVGVSSDAQAANNAPPDGFRIGYNTINNCPPLQG